MEFNVWGYFGAVVLQPKGVILITSTVAAGDAGGMSADGEASGSGSGRNRSKVTTGPVDVAEVRSRLGGAPSATDEELTESSGHSHRPRGPPARPPRPEWEDPATWPDDLHDGIVLAAVLTYRNAESPTPAAGVEGGAPVVPPIAWDRWTRHRLASYTNAGVWAQ